MTTTSLLNGQTGVGAPGAVSTNAVARRPRRALARVPGAGDARARTVQLVATPGSGDGRALETARRLLDALRARGYRGRLDVFPDLGRLQRWAAASPPPASLLICVGGDATQSAAAAAAVGRSVAFLPVPSGFGNLFARAFGHEAGGGPVVDRALDAIEHGTIVRADVGLRGGELFLSHESFGLVADIQARVEAELRHPRPRWQRWLAYYRGALRHLRDTRPPALRVEVDGRTIARDAAVVTAANVATYGGWLPLTPAASPVDGLLDVFVLRGTGRGAILARLLRRHLRLPGADREALLVRGRRVTVTPNAGAPIALELWPGALQVVVARETAARLTRGDRPTGVAIASAGRVA